jgi:hypothetical protein
MVPVILRESDAYYLLAFEPIEARDDVRHDIKVTVARKGVSVHAARYIAPSTPSKGTAGAPPPASPLERALTGAIPNASLPLEMSVATFAGPDRDHAYVGVTLDASAFATAPGSFPLEIALSASDERGKRIGGARQTGSVQVPPAAGGAAPFVELQSFLTLPPGDYELRGAVMNSETQAASSVFTHITVPAFDASHLALSDVVLGTRENAGALPEAAPAIPIAPTTMRVFGAGAPAWAFLCVYRGTGKDPVSVETSVVDGASKRVKHQSDTLRDTAFAGGTADIRLPLPLADLTPGEYVLRIDAHQGTSGASRTIAFTVVHGRTTIAPEPRSAETDSALQAAARYLDAYEHRISAIGAEEMYEQSVVTGGSLVVGGPAARQSPAVTPARATRKTRANMMTISLGANGWVSFRDVFELDGKPVRDRDERLSRILQKVDSDSLEQARKIAAESARYNLDAEALRVNRTTNVPMTALLFLRAANQSRSSFRLGKPERVGGVMCQTLQFTEQSWPRLIRTSDDAPAEGTFWIDMAGGGRIVKTELRMESGAARGQSVRTQTAVTYSHIDKLDLWVPTVMDEKYELFATRQTVTGHAVYSDFREFKVTTAENIK